MWKSLVGEERETKVDSESWKKESEKQQRSYGNGLAGMSEMPALSVMVVESDDIEIEIV